MSSEENKIEKDWVLREILDFFKDLAVVIILVIVIRTFLAMPFQINWQSMYSSYYDREFIVVDRLTYNFSNPSRGDVVVFKPRVSDEKKYFLKRVIWVPGDTLKIEWGNVYIKKSWSDEFVLLDESWYLNDENNGHTYVWLNKVSKIYTLWEDDYFVMWDNRNHSTDSRECFSNCVWRTEFVPKADIVWKVFVDLWYFNLKKFTFIQPQLWINTTPRFFSSPSTHKYEL